MSMLRSDPLFVLTVLSLLIVASEWLVRRTVLRHVGSALLVILLGALASNLGVIPAASTNESPVPLYDGIFSYVAPLSVFWLVLPVNLRAIVRAGKPMLLLFAVGSVATAAGVLVGMRVINGAEVIGPLYRAIGGMLTGTYTGGSVNFNAVALHYDVQKQGLLYGGLIVVDNILTAVWMGVTLVVPRALVRWRPDTAVARGVNGVSGTSGTSGTSGAVGASGASEASAPLVDLPAEREVITPRAAALVLALGTGALFLSQHIAAWLASVGVPLPAILVLTAIALLLAQIPSISALPGTRVAGMYAVYLFLVVIGAFCDLTALQGLGQLGLALLLLCAVIVSVHGVLTFGVAWLLRLDLDGAAVASQANIGGGTSALALAKSLGREDLILPGILLGAVGNAAGTFLGFAVAGWL